ncbi:MAG TPA: EF-hand domain-containing protein [Usitatibacter sp.]|jgi:Ca2+-binding EF-hand superfamily protein|nr:EF-hand domain-containing protein [Usitatibacter sp.]
MKTLALIAALGLASAATLVSAAPEGQGPMARLRAADTNGDGLISRDEAKALPRLAKHFDQIDTDRNGQISPEELKAAHQKMRAAMFDRMDANHDGVISRDEFNAFHAGHHHHGKQAQQ